MMTPAGGEHGEIGIELAYLLKTHVRESKLGRVYGADTGFLLERNPDTVRAPDAAFVRNDRLSGGSPKGFIPFAPDLAFEVLSPTDTASEIADKAAQYLDAGCGCVVVVDPGKRTITKYMSDARFKVYRTGDQFDGAPVLPGFQFSVSDLFAL